ncbi:putative c2h2-like zinc finger protein [Botrytis fragariae]|uniref:Putative c2h2-like zinc finger protein n=1 Tax=Botrytis fragariae TaxID=1964551 RepID=A0A8H6AN08_9HELO|nr:putative c2h2-like zinc finger protein [Botrytis fragariae]KAF5870220.1 putative c2h2-like zinc finger protein [Botrytis fragariae]
MKLPIKSRHLLVSNFLPHKSFLSFSYPRFQDLIIPVRHSHSTHSTSSIVSGEPDTALLALNDVQKQKELSQPPQQKVIVLWDLDNKPPFDSINPYEAAQNLRAFASRFGNVINIAAFANRSGMSFVPSSVIESRKELKEYYALEDKLHRKYKVKPDEPYVCGICGNKKKTQVEVVKHFKIHEKERGKKLNAAAQLKGKKKARFKARELSKEKNAKYHEAAVGIIRPADRFGEQEFVVNLVKSSSQAADEAIIAYSNEMGQRRATVYDWLILISDDTDFGDLVKRLSRKGVGTIVVGDRMRKAGGQSSKKLAMAACAWVPWSLVETGCIDKDAIKEVFANTLPTEKKEEKIRQIKEIFGVSEQDGILESCSRHSFNESDNQDISDQNISNQHVSTLSRTSIPNPDSDPDPYRPLSSGLPLDISFAE